MSETNVRLQLTRAGGSILLHHIDDHGVLGSPNDPRYNNGRGVGGYVGVMPDGVNNTPGQGGRGLSWQQAKPERREPRAGRKELILVLMHAGTEGTIGGVESEERRPHPRLPVPKDPKEGLHLLGCEAVPVDHASRGPPIGVRSAL